MAERSEYRDIEVSAGRWPDERSYRISLKDGKPFRVESVFAGYLGHLTYREVRVGGASWKRALKAASLETEAAQ